LNTQNAFVASERAERRPYGALRRALGAFFAIAPREAAPERRGFACPNAHVAAHLCRVGETFIFGYNSALSETSEVALAATLHTVPTEQVGFAFEGAAMALELLDAFTPARGRRFESFLAGAGAPHRFMLHVGAGWALARVPWRLQRRLLSMDPLLRWLALDGYGFHSGYFHAAVAVGRRSVPRRLTGYERRAFDQGLGRSLWFSCGTGARRIAETILGFDRERRADLWAGVGLAATYAGGVARADLLALRRFARGYESDLAQGAAFAAKARIAAGNLASHTEIACEVFCATAAARAAEATDIGLHRVVSRTREPAYEEWRKRTARALRAGVDE
jgi:enediyne biosynthesis protein E3